MSIILRYGERLRRLLLKLARFVILHYKIAGQLKMAGVFGGNSSPFPPTPSTEEVADIVMNKLHFSEKLRLAEANNGLYNRNIGTKKLTARGARVVRGGYFKVVHNAQNTTEIMTRRILTMLDPILAETVQRIRDFILRKVTVPLANQELHCEICQYLNDVIGDKRYGELAKLDAALRAAGHTPVIASGSNSGLPCITISVQPKDDTEKRTIAAVMMGIIRKRIVARGLGSEVLGDWKVRLDINTPYLEIRYPENEKDRKLIADTIIRTGTAVADTTNPLTNDTDF